MRPPTKSEKFLLGVLALVILGGIIFFGGRVLRQKQMALDLECASLRADNAEAAVDLQQASLWAERRDWMHEHESPMGDEGDTRAQLLNAVVQGARDHHLEVQQRDLGEVEHGPAGAKVGAKVRVKGSMEALCRWLAEMEQPGSFYGVDLLSLKGDQDEKSMVCTLHISRYFAEARR